MWDPDRVVIIPDHYIFTADARANRNVDILREMADKYKIKYFYDIKDRSNFKANPDYKGAPLKGVSSLAFYGVFFFCAGVGGVQQRVACSASPALYLDVDRCCVQLTPIKRSVAPCTVSVLLCIPRIADWHWLPRRRRVPHRAGPGGPLQARRGSVWH